MRNTAKAIVLSKTDFQRAQRRFHAPARLFYAVSRDGGSAQVVAALEPHSGCADGAGWGTLGFLQTWQLSKRGSRSQAELVAGLNALIDENAKLRQTVERIADLLTGMDRAPVSANEVVQSIAAPVSRVSATDDDRPGKCRDEDLHQLTSEIGLLRSDDVPDFEKPQRWHDDRAGHQRPVIEQGFDDAMRDW